MEPFALAFLETARVAGGATSFLAGFPFPFRHPALTARHLVWRGIWLKSDSVVPRILIVDDERDFVELVQYRLAGLGCEFIVANDGVQALSQARQFKPDLILLDILLPDLDGLSVCEILRRQPATKKIPVIFMSALSSEVTKRTVAMQADDFFTKPLDLDRAPAPHQRFAASRADGVRRGRGIGAE